MLTQPPYPTKEIHSSWLEPLQALLGLSSKLSVYLFLFLATVGVASLYPRFYDWENPVVEPQPIRQAQTAMTIRAMARGQASMLDYRSPYEGALWNFVIEFPLYQKIVSLPVKLGVSVEVASRAITFLSFLLGLGFFYGIVRSLLGPETATWSTLFYFLSPLSIVYSRVCLIDPFAIMLVLASVWFGLRGYIFSSRTAVFLSFICGSVSAIVKPTVWYSYATIFFCVVTYQCYLRRVSIKQWLVCLCVVTGQFLCAVTWLRFAMSVRGMTGALVGADSSIWIIGEFGWRFLWVAWAPIVSGIVRSLWHDWMVPLALISLFSRQRAIALVAFAGALFSIVGPFNVHRFHDYYLLTEAPYLFLAAGMGMSVLLQNRGWIQRSGIALCAAIFVYRLFTIAPTLAPSFRDFRSEIVPFQELALRTEPSDIIYSDIGPENWPVVYYSDRLVLQNYLLPSAKSKVTPSVYWFKDYPGNIRLLDDIKTIWIAEPTQKPTLYRSVEVGRYVLNTGHAVIVTDDIEMLNGKKIIPLKSKCDGGGWFNVREKGSLSQRLILSLEGKQIALPRKHFLFIPPENSQSCSLLG